MVFEGIDECEVIRIVRNRRDFQMSQENRRDLELSWWPFPEKCQMLKQLLQKK
jgi:hypothetical protein